MKVEIHEIEERKNSHINELMISHEQSFREMKEYFNDVTRENLDIIKQLHERLEEIKYNIAQSETVMVNLKENVQFMSAPLSIMEGEAMTLRKVVKNMSDYISNYRNAKGSLNDLKARMKNIKE